MYKTVLYASTALIMGTAMSQAEEVKCSAFQSSAICKKYDSKYLKRNCLPNLSYEIQHHHKVLRKRNDGVTTLSEYLDYARIRNKVCDFPSTDERMTQIFRHYDLNGDCKLSEEDNPASKADLERPDDAIDYYDFLQLKDKEKLGCPTS